MYDIYFRNITLNKLRQDEDTLSIKANNSDFISYIEFLKYFSDTVTIKRHNLIIGINFTYGWMPTIFEFCPKKIDECFEKLELALIILNAAKQGQIPTIQELQTLKECFNNSLVGTSKLLHFINPAKFAIWDSRVYRYLTNNEPYSYHLDNFSSYLDYLRFCDFITTQEEYISIHNSIIKKVGYEMTKFRTLELIMYFNGARPITKVNFDRDSHATTS